LRDITPVRALLAGDAPHQLPEDEYELELEPKPLRVVVVGALRDVLVLVDGLVLGDERLVSGTEADCVADVLERENTGRGQTLLLLLVLVRVQVEREP
jgi:hypothetical protein